jgi:hypothetical protein
VSYSVSNSLSKEKRISTKIGRKSPEKLKKKKG